jgi:hypothetical protein
MLAVQSSSITPLTFYLIIIKSISLQRRLSRANINANHSSTSSEYKSNSTLPTIIPFDPRFGSLTAQSCVGAHHQVLAERQIQTTFNWSRANLLHFVLHWPQMAKNRDNLWPFAVDYAVYLHNHLPILDICVSPLVKLTSIIFHNYNHLIRSHTFG